MYSLMVFGVGGALLGVMFLVLRAYLRRQTVTTLVLRQERVELGGRVFVMPRLEEQPVRTLESLFNELVLTQLARYSAVALVVLFVVSLVVGWWVAGRALSPISRITVVASDIQATDLSRRIGWRGPDDELARLAGTFDEMLDRLDRAFTAERRFLAEASHDLRNPLQIIRSNLDIILSDPQASSEEWRQTGEIIARAAERMSRMIEDLFAAARLESGTVAVTDLDLAEVVRAVGEEVRARAAAREGRVDVVAAPAPVSGDSLALTRALSNLVDNALRVSPPGSAIRLAAATVGEWAWMAVADQGPGIDPSLVEADNPRNTGLGLSIVRRIARSHGGRLSGVAPEGGGSLLVVWIPARGARPSSDPPVEALRAL